MLEKTLARPVQRRVAAGITLMRVGGVRQQQFALLLEALFFSSDKHRTQQRNGADIQNSMESAIQLAHILCNEAGITDELTLASAVLHDMIGDTVTSYEELRRHFGPVIADVVAELTNAVGLSKAERQRLEIESASILSHRARLITLARQIAMIRSVGRSTGGWIAEGRVSFAWAKSLVDGIRGTHATLEYLFDEAYDGCL